MRTLVIGGTGLISTAITRMLLERGDEVTLYNRGRTESILARQTKALNGDRKAHAAFEAQMAEAGEFDCVIDMICFDPAEAASAVRAFRGRAGQYIFCSTIDVYTKTTARYPVVEDAQRAPSPTFPYAHRKADCERILEEAHARGDIRLTIFRPAYTYAEGHALLYSYGDSVRCLARVREGLPLIVHGDGMSIWVACHRDDVARAFVAAAGNERAHGRAYNVTGEEWLTWNQYYRAIALACGAAEQRLVHIPTDLLARVDPAGAQWCLENFQYDNIFDNARAREELGFRYTIPWFKGARMAVEWLVSRDRIPSKPVYPEYDALLEAWERLGKLMVDECSA